MKKRYDLQSYHRNVTRARTLYYALVLNGNIHPGENGCVPLLSDTIRVVISPITNIMLYCIYRYCQISDSLQK